MEPILIDSQNPTWFLVLQSAGSVLGIIIVAVVTWNLARLKIRAGREDKWWSTQFACFTELREIFSGMYSIDKDGNHTLSISKSLQNLQNLGFNSVVLFANVSIDKLIDEALTKLQAEKDKGVIVFTDDIIKGVTLKIEKALKIMTTQLKKW